MVGSCAGDTRYRSQSILFSPTDLGAVTDRRRLYGSYALEHRVHGQYDLSHFENIFYRVPAGNCSMFLWGADGEDKTDTKLTSFEMGNLEGYILNTVADTLADRPVLLANLSHFPSFANVRTGPFFPTMTRTSRLYDLRGDRFVSINEIWTTLGFPHPSATSLSTMHKFFPLKQDMLYDSEQLSAGQQKQLLGNAMHVLQIGSWFLFHLGYIAKNVALPESVLDGSP